MHYFDIAFALIQTAPELKNTRGAIGNYYINASGFYIVQLSIQD